MGPIFVELNIMGIIGLTVYGRGVAAPPGQMPGEMGNLKTSAVARRRLGGAMRAVGCDLGQSAAIAADSGRWLAGPWEEIAENLIKRPCSRPAPLVTWVISSTESVQERHRTPASG